MKGIGSQLTKFFSIGALVTVILALALVAIPAQVVWAADSTQEPPPRYEDQSNPLRLPRFQQFALSRVFHRQQQIVAREENNLSRADRLASKLEERIVRLKEQGKDVSTLEDALTNFRDQLAASRQAHERAMVLVQQHNGFDEQGRVVNIVQARDTVQRVGKAIAQFRQTMRDGLRELRTAWRDYRSGEQPTAEPVP